MRGMSKFLLLLASVGVLVPSSANGQSSITNSQESDATSASIIADLQAKLAAAEAKLDAERELSRSMIDSVLSKNGRLQEKAGHFQQEEDVRRQEVSSDVDVVERPLLERRVSASPAPCSVTDGSGGSASYPCACGNSTCDGSADSVLCTASTSTCSPGPCSTSNGTGMSDTYPCTCGSATCGEATDTDGICNAATNTCWASCTVTDGSSLSDRYPCRCGNASCGSNEVCHEGTSTCVPEPCFVTDGNASFDPNVDVYPEPAYPCTCGGTTCSSSQDSYTLCDASASECAPVPCVTPVKGVWNATVTGYSSATPCPTGRIAICPGVSSIPEGAFGGCQHITQVELPDSVTTIEYLAFDRCTGLLEVPLGVSLMTIGNSAFNKCTGLTQVTFGDSVTAVGNQVLNECDNVIEVTFGDSVTSIGMAVASSLPILRKVTIGNGIATIPNSAFADCFGLEQVSFGESVTIIEQSSFRRSNLTELVFPDSLVEIHRFAFLLTPSLKKVTFGKSLAHLGLRAFLRCTSLEEVTLRGGTAGATIDNDVWGDVSLSRVIYEGAVAGGNLGWSVENIQQVDMGDAVERILYQGFRNHGKLVEVKMGPSLTDIGAEAFEGCVLLEKMTIPPAVRTIERRAFAGCANLTEVEIEANVETVLQDVFNGTGLEKVTFASPATTVADYQFRLCCPDLRNVVLNENITSIAEGAFHGVNIRQVDLPLGVMKIAKSTFEGCTELIKVNMPAVTIIESNAFKNCEKLEEVILDSLEKVESAAFLNCSSLQRLEFPRTLQTIGSEAFKNCAELQQANFTSSSQLETIGESAFENTGVSAASIPPSAKEVGARAFSRCSQLKKVSMTVRFPYFQAGSGIFSESHAITDVFVDVADSIALSNLFPEENSIARVEIASGLVSKRWISSNCTALRDITIQNNEIPPGAWSSCPNLRTALVGEGVTIIGESAFRGCSALRNVEFASDSNVVSIGDRAFEKCISLTSATIPSKTVEVGRAAFQDCSNLQRVSINGPIKTIREELLKGCTNLVHIDFPSSTTSIGEAAFSGCSSLESILLPSSVSFIAERGFEACSSLRHVQLPHDAIIGKDALAISATMNISVAGASPGDTPAWSSDEFAQDFGCRDTFLPRVERDSRSLSCQCPEGELYNSTHCQECKEHLKCFGGHLQSDADMDLVDTGVTVDQGYMTLPHDPFSVYRCVEEEDDPRCEGDRAVASAEMCKHNADYRQPRCAVCKEGFVRGTSHKCETCAEVNRVVPALKGVLAFAIQFALMAKVYYESARLMRPRHAILASGIEFVQVMQVIMRLDVTFTDQFAVLRYFFDLLTFSKLFERFQFKEGCLFGEGYLLTITIQVVAPLVLILNLPLLYLLYRCTLGQRLTFSRIHSTIGVALCTLFLTIVSLSLSLFFTETMPNHKVMVRAFPELEHGSDEWKEALPLNLVATSVYCIPLIAYVAYVVWRAPRMAAESPDFFQRYDFMIGGVRPDRWWWILFKLAMGLILTFAQVILPDNVRSQIYLTLLSCFGFLMAEFTAWPAEFEDGNIASCSFKLSVTFTLIVITSFPLGPHPFDPGEETVLETWSWVAIAVLVFAVVDSKVRAWKDVLFSLKNKGVQEAEAQQTFWQFRDIAMAMMLMPEHQLAQKARNCTQYDNAHIKKTTDTIVNLIFDSQTSERWSHRRVMHCPHKVWDHHAQVAGLMQAHRSGSMARDIRAKFLLREQIIRLGGAMYSHAERAAYASHRGMSSRIVTSVSRASGFHSSAVMVSEAVSTTFDAFAREMHHKTPSISERAKSAMGLGGPAPELTRHDFAKLLAKLRLEMSTADADGIWEILDADESGLVPVSQFTKLLSTLAPMEFMDALLDVQEQEPAAPQDSLNNHQALNEGQDDLFKKTVTQYEVDDLSDTQEPETVAQVGSSSNSDYGIFTV